MSKVQNNESLLFVFMSPTFSNEIEMCDLDGGLLLSPMAESEESLISATSSRNDRAKADLLETKPAEVFCNSGHSINKFLVIRYL